MTSSRMYWQQNRVQAAVQSSYAVFGRPDGRIGASR
jgi:hypothetical protein